MDDGPDARGGSVAEALPGRERADNQVAAGSVAGVVAGAVSLLLAMLAVRSEGAFLLPLRLVAASFLGESALDSGVVVGPVALGMVLAALVSVLFGLVYVSILPERAGMPLAVLVGLLYALALWGVAWFVLARVLDPILYAAVSSTEALALHALYGVGLGVLVPFLRRILP